MDTGLPWVPQESSQPREHGEASAGPVHPSNQPDGCCQICRRVFSSDNEMVQGFEALCICNSCRIMFLDDLNTTTRDSRRRIRSRNRAGYIGSSESIDDIFSQEFSHLINMARQTQHNFMVSDHGLHLDVDGNTLQRDPSPYSALSWWQRRRRAYSDNESEGFDNVESLFGESDTNASFSGYGAFHGESDGVSYSAYGANSDASLDGQSFVDRDMFLHHDGNSPAESDTDIDPMHAGLDQWDSNVEDEDGEWVEADGEEEAVETTGHDGWARGALSADEANNGSGDWELRIPSPRTRWRIRQRLELADGIRLNVQPYVPNISRFLERNDMPTYVGNSGDDLDSRSFEELLEHLAETDNSRRGAPPASASFVGSLPKVVIGKEHEKHGNLICAVCKDPLTKDTEANQLPCLHLYHPLCILPWLNSRNSCPVCRYELPTDDVEYEEGKQYSGIAVHGLQQQGPTEVGPSNSLDETEGGESGNLQLGFLDGARIEDALEISDVGNLADSDDRIERMSLGIGNVDQGPLINTVDSINPSTRQRGARGGWFFLATAPIVSIVGIVLVLWFGNPLTEGRLLRGARQRDLRETSGSSSRDVHHMNRPRRWWSLF
ncbi:hypothetical protein AMTRI_Chr08g168660 [Amborella trichopoda]|uniref:uncharacterized protein LOC18432436 n=1 Tax=Amborella trichopoda TaxID=13333 RepID=UPI0005D4287B|nr:uncharacterized protein LOC18432436 [Amborella trichopoda]XP_020521801.1 uncharacterized protein LOC18432436 [Amborella trichopoda]XP_020521803.1 uncharacterized protein LOC18432436 [Amborella trichopoda]XP_020521804.1 uncharacterized protein LOC18432436 [Amborella trichopoda]|eukprot:XP_011622701.1 uncharacterized protein LOC18432436 [Amborella trichopoda]